MDVIRKLQKEGVSVGDIHSMYEQCGGFTDLKAARAAAAAATKKRMASAAARLGGVARLGGAAADSDDVPTKDLPLYVAGSMSEYSEGDNVRLSNGKRAMIVRRTSKLGKSYLAMKFIKDPFAGTSGAAAALPRVARGSSGPRPKVGAEMSAICRPKAKAACESTGGCAWVGGVRCQKGSGKKHLAEYLAAGGEGTAAAAAPVRRIRAAPASRIRAAPVVASSSVVIEDDEDDARAYFAGMCKKMPKSECESTPVCKWMGGKMRRCQRAVGAQASDAAEMIRMGGGIGSLEQEIELQQQQQAEELEYEFEQQ